MRCRDVQQHNFIGARFCVAESEFRRVARIDNIDELHAFHHAPGINIETGDDTFGQHG
jgi:hypothetical protein